MYMENIFLLSSLFTTYFCPLRIYYSTTYGCKYESIQLPLHGICIFKNLISLSCVYQFVSILRENCLNIEKKKKKVYQMYFRKHGLGWLSKLFSRAKNVKKWKMAVSTLWLLLVTSLFHVQKPVSWNFARNSEVVSFFQLKKWLTNYGLGCKWIFCWFMLFFKVNHSLLSSNEVQCGVKFEKNFIPLIRFVEGGLCLLLYSYESLHIIL